MQRSRARSAFPIDLSRATVQMATISVPVVSILYGPSAASATAQLENMTALVGTTSVLHRKSVLLNLWLLIDDADDADQEVEGPGGKAKVRVAAQTLTVVLPSPISVADEDEETERTRDALDAAGGNSYQVSDLQLQSREDRVLVELTWVRLQPTSVQ